MPRTPRKLTVPIGPSIAYVPLTQGHAAYRVAAIEMFGEFANTGGR